MQHVAGRALPEDLVQASLPGAAREPYANRNHGGGNAGSGETGDRPPAVVFAHAQRDDVPRPPDAGPDPRTGVRARGVSRRWRARDARPWTRNYYPSKMAVDLATLLGRPVDDPGLVFVELMFASLEADPDNRDG